MKELVALAFNMTKGDASLQNYDADQALRAAFLEEAGVSLEDINTPAKFKRHKNTFYAILEEVISPVINDRFDDFMARFAEVRNVGYGDTTEFRIENPELYEVAKIAQGTSNLTRQRITEGKMTVPMHRWGVKVYDELYPFLAGRINWARVVQRVADSFERKLGELAVEAVYGSYNQVDAAFKYSGAFDEAKVLEVLAKVEAAYGNAILVGTKQALAKVKPTVIGDASRDQFNNLGYFAVFQGYETVALPNFFKNGEYDFAISNTDLLVLPAANEKIIKIVHEGGVEIHDHQNVNGDLSLEHTMMKNIGVGVAEAAKYGIIRFTA